MHDVAEQYGAQKPSSLARGVHHASRRSAQSPADGQAQAPTPRAASGPSCRNLDTTAPPPQSFRERLPWRRATAPSPSGIPQESIAERVARPSAMSADRPVALLRGSPPGPQEMAAKRTARHSARSPPRESSMSETTRSKTSFRIRSSRRPEQSATTSASGKAAARARPLHDAPRAFRQSLPIRRPLPKDRPAAGCENATTKPPPKLNPASASTRKAARHPKKCTSGTISTGASAPPSRLAAHTMPWQRARSRAGNHRAITPAMLGYAPAAPSPKKNRDAHNCQNPRDHEVDAR